MTEVSNGGRILDESSMTSFQVVGFANNSFEGSFSILPLSTDLGIVLSRPRMGKHSESQILVGCSWISDYTPCHICLCAFSTQTKGLGNIGSKYPSSLHVFKRGLDGLFFDRKVFVIAGRQ